MDSEYQEMQKQLMQAEATVNNLWADVKTAFKTIDEGKFLIVILTKKDTPEATFADMCAAYVGAKITFEKIQDKFMHLGYDNETPQPDQDN